MEETQTQEAETRSSSTSGQKKEIYTHDADWTIYARTPRG